MTKGLNDLVKKKEMAAYLKGHADAFKFKKHTSSQAQAAYSFNHYLGKRADLGYIQLAGSEFLYRDLSALSCHTESYELSSVGINKVHWLQADFSEVDMVSASIVSLTAAKVKFSRALLPQLNVKYSTFYKCQFTEALLPSAQIENCILNSSVFRRADLENAQMHETKADNAIFNQANLPYMTINLCKFRQADFSGANLYQMTINNSDISGADFRYANLMGVTLNNVVKDHNTKWDGAVLIGVQNLVPLPVNAITTVDGLIQAMQEITVNGPLSKEQLSCYTTTARCIIKDKAAFMNPPYLLSAAKIEEVRAALQPLELRYPLFSSSYETQFNKHVALLGDPVTTWAPTEDYGRYGRLAQLRTLFQSYRVSSETSESNLDVLPPEAMVQIAEFALGSTFSKQELVQIVNHVATKETLPKKEDQGEHFMDALLATTEQEKSFVAKLQREHGTEAAPAL